MRLITADSGPNYRVHFTLLGFSTAARKLAPRDRFIGWTPTLREKNLPKIIDNARFLILPWIRIPTSPRTSCPSCADS